METQRKNILDSYKKKQTFLVSTGKKYIINGEEKMAKWFNYETFDKKWLLREVLNDEVVIEFDTDDKNKGWEGINFTTINLTKDNISFSIWDHGGRSPHLHIHNLPCGDFEKQKRALFKKFFIKKYVPEEYQDCVDTSLCGIHLLRIEWATCFKNKYGIKKLLHEFLPGDKLEW